MDGVATSADGHGEPSAGHFLTIEEWSGRKPKRLSIPGPKSGRQRIVVDFEDGERISVSSTSMDRAWDVLRRRLTMRAVRSEMPTE